MKSEHDESGEHAEKAVIVAKCEANAPWQDFLLCLMRQQYRQLVTYMTL